MAALGIAQGVSSQILPGFIDKSLNYNAIYSIRRVYSYNGAIVKLRRSTDNATLDFYDNDMTGVLKSADSVLLSTWSAGTIYVNTWFDQSGNNRHAIQATTTLQPIFNTDVVFSGAQKLMCPDATIPTGNLPYSLFAHHGVVTYGTIISQGGAGDSMTNGIAAINAKYYNYWHNNDIVYATSTTANNRILSTYVARRKLYVNNLFVISDTVDNMRLDPGAPCIIGEDVGGTLQLTGNLKTIIVMNTVATIMQRTQLEIMSLYRLVNKDPILNVPIDSDISNTSTILTKSNTTTYPTYMELNGSVLGASGALNFTEDFSITYDIYLNYGSILFSLNGSIDILLTTENIYFLGVSVATFTTITTGVWHSIEMSRKSNIFKLIVDDVVLASTTNSGVVNAGLANATFSNIFAPISCNIKNILIIKA